MHRAIAIGAESKSSFLRLRPAIGRNRTSTAVVGFCTGQPDSKMEKQKPELPKKSAREDMSQSYGDAYATRSEEEGFGGIYGGSEDLDHEKPPEQDESQGSEVKEEEKGRNAKKADV